MFNRFNNNFHNSCQLTCLISDYYLMGRVCITTLINKTSKVLLWLHVILSKTFEAYVNFFKALSHACELRRLIRFRSFAGYFAEYAVEVRYISKTTCVRDFSNKFIVAAFEFTTGILYAHFI